MKRRPMSRRASKKSFRRGAKVHRKNGASTSGIMRGGIRL